MKSTQNTLCYRGTVRTHHFARIRWVTQGSWVTVACGRRLLFSTGNSTKSSARNLSRRLAGEVSSRDTRETWASRCGA